MSDPSNVALAPDRISALADRLEAARLMLSRISRPESAAASASNVDDDVFELEWALREELEDIAAGLAAGRSTEPGGVDLSATMRAPDGLAVMVGHKRASPGAEGACPPFAPDDRLEYGWNADLARRIFAVAATQGVRCKLFTRDGMDIAGSYDPVKTWGPAATVELHFNAAGAPVAKGTLTLYGAEASRPWAQLLQDRIAALFDRRRRHEDRGVHMPGQPGSGYARGARNVAQIHPSALIEPFFGDNPADAELGVRMKQQLAEAVVGAYADFVGRPAPKPQPGNTDGQVSDAATDGLFARLQETYDSLDPPIAGMDAETAKSLKTITLAQWAEESGWGTSRLATDHFNFAGMKALSEVEPILTQVSAQKIWYEAHDGFDWYLRFASIDDFIKGYFLFLDRSPYRGWREAAKRSSHDFIRFIGRIWSGGNPGYADRVIAIERRILRSVRVEPRHDPGDGLPVNLDGVPADAALFRELVLKHQAADPDLARMAPVLAAQWAHESDFGRSPLAFRHYNFAGLEWSEQLSDIAARTPHPTRPEKGDFCRFLDLAHFVEGYRRRLERDPAFDGWRERTRTSEDFIAFLSDAWRRDDPGYARALTALHAKFSPRSASPKPDPSPRPAPRPGGGSHSEIDRGGFVMKIKRTRCERARGRAFDRTVGSYTCYFEGVALPGLSGAVYERQGPGDNNATGRANHRRVEAGVYPLSTHAGDRNDHGVTLYRTLGYSASGVVGQASRPCVRLLGTRGRSGVLFHPADGYLWSVGCFNLSKPLAPLGRIEWSDSRARVIAVIDAMRNSLGARFPADANKPIPDAVMIVEGEPGPAGAPPTSMASASAFGRLQLDAARTTLASPAAAELSVYDMYHLFESALVGGAEAGDIDIRLVSQILDGASDVSVLRDESGAGVWTPFVGACSIVETHADPAARMALFGILSLIADKLVARVTVEDDRGPHTPMVEASVADSPAALAQLKTVGASVDGYDRSGMTPLLAAAYYASVAALRWLLENGADRLAKTTPPTLRDESVADVVSDDSTNPPPVGFDAMACAEAGKRSVEGDDEALDLYETTISELWRARN